MSSEGIIKIVILISYTVFLLWAGFRPKAGFAGWFMFANVSTCRFKLTYNDGTNFNPWDYLPHSCLTMDEAHLHFFLFFLREIKELELSGEVEVRVGFKRSYLKVEHTYVVA